MKIASVLLRWYKSFNVNYMGYPDDRVAETVERPWNKLGTSHIDTDEYHFIEISLEKDITTIVGGNESGKSHLLNAISKVLTGKGIAESFRADGSPFSRTDLCHYTVQRGVNANDWPNIGLVFTDISQDETTRLCKAAEITSLKAQRLAIVLAPDGKSTEALLYIGNDQPISLDSEKLKEVRDCLPRVEFIHSNLAIDNQFCISALIKAYKNEKTSDEMIYGFAAVNQMMKFLDNTSFSSSGNGQQNVFPSGKYQEFLNIREQLQNAKIGSKDSELEVKLFRDILGISVETLEFLASLDIKDRTYADSYVDRWNQEIEQKLNLSHYWKQDDSFKLQINYKQGVLFFEITDRTGATYTFKERSSGLRYFLSYYIQAKAIENTSNEKSAIILMDEPDSFLSIMGQRNLLSIFESLIHPASSCQQCQLVYTTHSPFLLNRNFPARLRLVRKGDVEEGTQVIRHAMLRRYEPVRSALGIDCAQTLFMGATNVVVEGPSDQYILCELIRHFARLGTVSDFLDLNSVVVLSAESASSVEKLLSASQWGDEPVPSTVVILDSDTAGDESKKRIIGKARSCKKLIEEDFVISIGDVFEKSGHSPLITTEDIIPVEIYIQSVKNYYKKWQTEEYADLDTKLSALPSKYKEQANSVGIVDLVKVAVSKTENANEKCEYDKFGVFQEVIATLDAPKTDSQQKEVLRKRLVTLCQEIRKCISKSQQATRTWTGKKTINLLGKEFFIQHKNSCNVYDAILLLERIQRETDLLGVDGEKLVAAIKNILAHLTKILNAGQTILKDEEWNNWSSEIQKLAKNPIDFETSILQDGTFDISLINQIDN